MQGPLELPDFELRGQSGVFDVLDWTSGADIRSRTPLDAVLFEFVPSPLQEQIRTAALRPSMEVLATSIKAALDGRKAGYLLRINLYARDAGPIFSPAESLLSTVGLGLEPLDALAEATRAPGVRATRPIGLRDASYYFWLNERRPADGRTHLIATHIPASTARELETRAWAEAQRRDLTKAAYIVPASNLYARVRQALYWNQVYADRLAAIQNAKQRSLITALNERFTRAQERFNEAYEGYQKVERQIAAHARETAVIDAVDNVLSGVKGHLQERARESTQNTSNGEAGQGEAPPPINNQAMSRWREQRARSIAGMRDPVVAEVRKSHLELVSSQNGLRSAWLQAGVSLPAEPQINIQLP